jgi:catechol 2,3-dioxygenase-like lactoylglutathione lyase family enzyme
MFNTINISHIWVFDQDEALDFYVGKLGLEVGSDVDLGFMRWLTVRVPGESGKGAVAHFDKREILLELPSPPSVDEEAGAQIRELVAKGATGLTVGFTTDDCRKTYETLKARGVEFTQEPTQQSYGIDCGARDPFGNQFRFVQPPG